MAELAAEPAQKGSELGSVTSLSNVAGVLANTYMFDAFGNQTLSSESLINPFRYTGREFDQETGIDYYRFRYYDPSVGSPSIEPKGQAIRKLSVVIGDNALRRQLRRKQARAVFRNNERLPLAEGAQSRIAMCSK